MKKLLLLAAAVTASVGLTGCFGGETTQTVPTNVEEFLTWFATEENPNAKMDMSMDMSGDGTYFVTVTTALDGNKSEMSMELEGQKVVLGYMELIDEDTQRTYSQGEDGTWYYFDEEINNEEEFDALNNLKAEDFKETQTDSNVFVYTLDVTDPFAGDYSQSITIDFSVEDEISLSVSMTMDDSTGTDTNITFEVMSMKFYDFGKCSVTLPKDATAFPATLVA